MKVNKFKFLELMVFITILMDVLPHVGFFRMGSLNICTLQIPAILTSIVLGPLYGMGIAFLFGVISLMRALARESALLDMLLQNPMISIMPRMCFPLISGFLYKVLSRYSEASYPMVPVLLASAAGSVSNSVLVLASIYLIYPEKFYQGLNLAGSTEIFHSVSVAYGSTLFWEAGICMAVCAVAVVLVRKVEVYKERQAF